MAKTKKEILELAKKIAAQATCGCQNSCWNCICSGCSSSLDEPDIKAWLDDLRLKLEIED